MRVYLAARYSRMKEMQEVEAALRTTEAHAVIAFTEPEGSTYCKPLLVVGPLENIFYSLAFAKFETVEELLSAVVIDGFFGSTWRGICASCGCTEETACSGIGQDPCAWVDERQIYCTRCVIDRQVAKKRREIAPGGMVRA